MTIRTRFGVAHRLRCAVGLALAALLSWVGAGLIAPPGALAAEVSQTAWPAAIAVASVYPSSSGLTVTALVTQTGNIYVSTGGSDAAGNGSQGLPYATMAMAISRAASGSTIRVGAGTYDCTVTVPVGVSIVGAGSSQTTLTARGTGRVLVYNRTGAGQSLSNLTVTGGAGNAYGGGIYIYSASPAITACVITDNSSTANGGGVYSQSSNPTFTNSVISSNTAASTGGGLYATGGAPTVLNCTIARNRASVDGGVAAVSGALPQVVNSIVAGNNATSSNPDANTVTSWTSSCIGTFATPSLLSSGSVMADPFFRDPAGHDFRLSPGSVGIDTADSTTAPATDLLGVSRPQGVGVDMGAYEYVFTPRIARADNVTMTDVTWTHFNVCANDDPSESTVAKRTAVGFSAVSTGTLVTAASGDVTYTPPPRFVGQATFTYVADYETTRSAPATVTITVQATTAPVATSDGIPHEIASWDAPTLDGSQFGKAVAVDGDTAVIGAPFANSSRGAVYIATRRAGRWGSPVLLAAGQAAGDQFGAAVDIDGDSIIVGAPAAVNGRGEAFVIQRDASGVWGSPILAGLGDVGVSLSPYEGLGTSVSIDGGVAVMGAPWAEQTPGTYYINSGAVYESDRDASGAWSMARRVVTPDTSGRFLGYSVSVQGDTLVAGSPFSSPSTAQVDRGEVWIYQRVNGAWAQVSDTRGETGHVQYGYSVDVSGDTVLVGSRFRNTSEGAVYEIKRGTTGSWAPPSMIATGALGEQLGTSVAVKGDMAIAGAPGTNSAEGTATGSVRVLLRAGGVWKQSTTLASSQSGPNEGLGFTAALASGTVVAGAPMSPRSGVANVGTLRTFDPSCYAMAEDQTLTVPSATGVLENDTYTDGDTLTPSLVDTSALHGTMDLRSDGSFTYTPEADFNGTATATYRDFDGTGYSAPATITITVTPVNDAPVAVDDGLIRVGQTFPTHAPPGTNDLYGSSSAVQGDSAVITAGNGSLGAVYFYSRNRAGVWSQTQRFALDHATNVVMNGDTVVVGQRNDDLVTVFVRIGGVWTLQQTLSDGNGIWGDEFDFQVALDGDTLVVGTPRYNRWVKVNGAWVNPPGSAYVYTRSGGIWTKRAELTASTESTSNDLFGSQVGIQGDTIMVSGRYGGTWDFERTGADWSSYTQTKLALAHTSALADTGGGIAIDGDTAFVGASLNGAVNILKRTPAGWTQIQSLVEGAQYFGTAVAVQGDNAVVGYYDHQALYMYRRGADGVWRKTASLPAPGGWQMSQMGINVSMSGTTVITGDVYAHITEAGAWGASQFWDVNQYLTDEDTSMSVDATHSLLANDHDVDGDALTCSLVDTSALHGTIDLAPNGTFTYTPEKDFSGTATATYRAFDGTVYSAPATLTITVAPVNDAPGAANDAVTCAQDSSVTIDAFANDTDIDTPHASLVATDMSTPAHGTVSLSATGSVVYIPAPGFYGTDSFTYRVYDGTAVSAPATVTITVSPANRAPVAVGDGLVQLRQTIRSTFPSGTPEFYGESTAVQGDTAVVTAGNGIRGSVYFYAKDKDGTWSQTQRFPLDHATNVVLNGDTVVVGQRGDELVTVFVRIGGVWTLQQTLTDGNGIWGDEFDFQVAVDGDTLVVGTPRYNRWISVNGKTVNPPGSAYVYTRSGGVWTKQAELTASTESTVSDLFGSQVGIQGDTIMVSGRYSGTWAFQRTGANWSSYTQTKLALAHTAAVADSGQGIAIDGDTAFVGASLNNAVNVLKRTPAGWTQVQSLAGGKAYFGYSLALQGDTAVVGYYGHAPYLYRRGADGVWRQTAALPDPSGWQMHILGVNVALSGTTVLAGDIDAYTDYFGSRGMSQFWDVNQYLTDEDTSMSVDATHSLLANDHDVDGDALTASLVDTSAIHGTIDLAPDGTFTYTPEKDFAGTATATYRAFDGALYSAPATITITVAPVDDAPAAVNDTATCAQDSSTTIDVLANDTDIDTPHASLVATSFSTPLHGTVSLSATGSVIYTPAAGFDGTDAFTYKAFDGQLYSAPATVTIAIIQAPDGFLDPEGGTVPVGSSLTTTFTVGVPATFTISASGDPTPTLVWSGGPVPSGLATSTAGRDGILSGSAATGSAGTYDLTLTATNAGGSAAITLHVVVIGSSHTITPLSGPYGRICPNSPVTVAWGEDSPTFNMLPDVGYHVSDVSIDGVSVGASSSVTLLDVTADHTIFATFSKTKPVFRIGGANRYQTAIAIARTMYPGFSGVRHVVLASGDSRHMPDALTGAGLASAYGGPVLLVPKTWLDTDVKAALLAMPKGVQVHVLGSSAAVNDSVLSKIKKLRTVKSVDRVSGSDRFGTAAAIAKRMKKVMGHHFPTTALVTSGRDSWLFDPLIASTASAAKDFPVLLVKADSVPATTRSAMRSVGIKRSYLLGSPLAVNESVRASLKINPADRIFGSDVYGDSVAFAQRARAEGWLSGNTIGFAATLPDTASSGAFMGSRGAPVILVGRTSVPADVTGLLAGWHDSIEYGYAFGGPAALDEPTRVELEREINGF